MAGLLDDFMLNAYGNPQGAGLLGMPMNIAPQQQRPSISDWLGNNQNALMMMGLGMASGGTVNEGLRNAMLGLSQGRDKDQAVRSRNETAQALVRRGVDPQTAASAVQNPELLKAILPTLFVKPEFKEMDPAKRYGWVSPPGGSSAGGAPSGPASLGGPSPAPMNARPTPGVQVVQEPAPSTNPYSPTPQMNEAQSKDATYANRMFAAENVLRDTGVQQAGLSATERTLASIPLVGNYAVSKEYQKYDQAQRDFINATLRRESGAVISPSEFENANKQYFPQPGDSPEVLAQKTRNRQEAIMGIAGGAGQHYQPPATFNDAGDLVANKRPGMPAMDTQRPSDYGQERGNPAMYREPPQANAQPQQAPLQSAPIKVTTQAQYSALRPGQTYIAPDGTTRTKR